MGNTIDPQVRFSSLWLFAILNYLYCDVMGLMDASLLRQYLTGTVNGMEMGPAFLAGSAVLMQIPIGMVVLSRLLAYRANRWANVGAGAVMTIVQTATLFVGKPAPYYVLCSVLEIGATVAIVWLAVRWRPATSA